MLGQPGSPERSRFLHELLAALHVFQRDLDGDDAADRSAAIRLLATLSDDPATATDLWNALVSTTAVVNPQAATMTEATLRRRLSRHRVRPSQRHGARLATLDNLERSLRSRVRPNLVQPSARGVAAPPAPFELPREDALAALVDTLTAAAGSALIVNGQADSGKSALTIRAATVLREGGAHVVLLHAADCAGVGTAADPFDGLLGDTLGCVTTAENRYLVIDGAETATGDGPLRPLIDAALAADYTPVIVTRDDSADDVNGVLTDALIAGGHTTVPDRHTVDPLTDEEIRAIVDHFPALTTVAARPRAGDLLDKPGLVDTLLRARPAFDDDQAPLTELDVFDAFWTQVVRSPNTQASPTGRDTAATAIARLRLRHDQSLGPTPEPESVDALRSDGILAPYSTFAGQDTFASDLYLDFATARVLLTDGLQILIDAPSPRWALRATRLAVQARLSAGRAAGGAETAGAADIDALRSELAAIAAEHGARWTQLLDEAILGHPNARELLTAAGPTLVADAQRLHDFLDTATRVHVVEGAATPTSGRGRRTDHNPALDALAPVVDLLLDHESTVVGHGNDLRDQSDALVLAFLRGAAWHRFPTPHADTVRRIAAALSGRGDHYRTRPPLEAFALLGPDFEAIGRPRLEAIAAEAPHELDAVVESRFSIRALLDYDPTLLADLSLAYYLEESESSGSLFTFNEDGVRGHSLHLGPLRIHSGPDRGPFLPLLIADPGQGLRVVHAVLERGAAVRQQHMSRLGSSMPRTAAEEHTERPIALQLGRPDPREYVGDSQVWYWYRRSGVGQDSCISAAMALETYADYLISAGTDPNMVVDLIMAGAGSLAECGVAFSVIVRNLPETGPRIAEWLQERAIWELETERVTHEYHAIARPGDDPELRAIPTNSLASKLVWDAMASGDREQLARLAQTADALEAGVADHDDDDQKAAVVRLSAALLRPETYDLVERPDRKMMFVPRPPDTVTQSLASGNRDLERFQQAIRLQMDWSPTSVHHPSRMHLTTYLTPAGDQHLPALAGPDADPDTFRGRVQADIAVARSLTDDPLPPMMDITGAAPASALAAAVLTHDLGDTVTRQDRDWAITTLIAAATTIGPGEMHDTTDDHLASRAAARGLPAVLATTYANTDTRTDPESDRVAEVIETLHALATHPSPEVRRTLVVNLRGIWSTPCWAASNGRCVHQEVLNVVGTLLRRVIVPPEPALDPNDGYDDIDDDPNAGAAEESNDSDHAVEPETAPPASPVGLAGLADVPDDQLDTGVLATALSAVIDAAESGCPHLGVVLPEIEDALLTAFLRAASHRFDRYAMEMTAAAAARHAQRTGSLDLIRRISLALVGRGPLPIWHAGLRDAVAADSALGPVIGIGWPALAAELLPLAENMHDLGSLLPPGGGDWPTPDDLAVVLPGWIAAGAGDKDAIDIYCTWATMNDLPAARVLDHLDLLITNPTVSSQLWHIAELFEQLRTQQRSPTEDSRMYRWIDQFAANGDSRFQRMQQDPD